MEISARRLSDVLGVVDYRKRAELRAAIWNHKMIVLHGNSTEGKALIRKMEEYQLPYLKAEDSYFFEEREDNK